MWLFVLAAGELALGQAAVPEPEHAANPVFARLLAEGFRADGASAAFPAPRLRDGQSADAQRAALKAVAGSDQALDELLRDSVTARFELKNRTVEAKHGVIRLVDLWFTVRGSLDEIDSDQLSGRESKKGSGEVGNMRFEGQTLTEADLSKRKRAALAKDERYAHSKARLLDRIGVESTNHAFGTRSSESVVLASITAPEFENDPEYPNRWRPISQQGGKDTPGAPHPYAGGASYAKVSALKLKPGMLLVEVHAAFTEPKAWFDGAPILRSKTSLVAQDRVRELRREIAKRRKEKGR